MWRIALHTTKLPLVEYIAGLGAGQDADADEPSRTY